MVDIAYAIKNSEQQSAISNQQKENNQKSSQGSRLTKQKPEEKFQKTIEDIEKTLTDTTSDTDTKKNKLKTKRSEIEGLDTAIKKQFSDTEKFLKEKGLPPEILERHYKFVKHYEDNLKELNDNLSAIDKSKTKTEADAAISRARAHLEKVKAPKKHIFDPNRLPFTTPEIKTFEKIEKQNIQEPKTHDSLEKKAALGKDKAPILIASAGSLDGLLAQASDNTTTTQNTPPTETDLEENGIEIQFTPEIRELAESLGYNALKIYQYVRNNFSNEIYYGSLKGAQQTLLEKAGNDFDQVSLLISLLRTSNIPARYVYGTVEIPIEDVKSWIGIDDTNMALTALASSGIPLTAMTSGGAVSAVRLEHVWCQAFISYGPSRGALEGSGDMWVDLDPSFKSTHKEIAENIELPSFNQTTFLSAVNQNDPVAAYESDIQSYLDTIFADRTTGAVKLQKEIEALWFEYLLGTLPYDVIASTTFAATPDNYRYKITFSVSDEETELFGTPLTYTTTAPELAGRRVSLSYSPATDADSILVDKYGGLYNVPAYLLQLKPEIRINSEIKASGSAIGFGKSQIFRIDFRMPYGRSDYVENIVMAGGYYVSVMNLQTVPEHQVLVRTEKFRELDEILQSGGNVALDDYAGEILYLTGLAYFQKLNATTKNAEQLLKVVDIKGISEAIVSIDVSVEYVFGMPLKVSLLSLGFDVDRNIHLAIPIDGNMNKKKEFMVLSGMTSSFYEHKVLEEIYNVDSVSAIKIIQIANERGVPVYTLNSGNISSYINSLQVSNDVKTDILNAINAGMEVTIPQQEFQINDWFGTGYIVMNPQSGAGAYMISGGLAGSCLAAWSLNVLNDILSFRVDPAFAGTVGKSLEPNYYVRFPGPDDEWYTSDDKNYFLVDLWRLPEEVRLNIYFDPHQDRGDSGLILIDETNQDDYITSFLQLIDFSSKIGNYPNLQRAPYLRLHPSLIFALQLIKTYIGSFATFSINHGYRTMDHYEEIKRQNQIKGVKPPEKDSWHMDGLAADVVVSIPGKTLGQANLILRDAALLLIYSANNGGVGYYPNFVHMDTRGWRAKW